MLGILYRGADRLRARLRRRKWPATQAVGRLGEDLAHRYLASRGYRVIARNWRLHRDSGDEMDIIALREGLYVFVEVKTRTSAEDGAPDRAVDPDKLRAWRRLARWYMIKASRPDAPRRLDLINVVLEPSPRLQHIEDAFSPE